MKEPKNLDQDAPERSKNHLDNHPGHTAYEKSQVKSDMGTQDAGDDDAEEPPVLGVGDGAAPMPAVEEPAAHEGPGHGGLHLTLPEVPLTDENELKAEISGIVGAAAKTTMGEVALLGYERVGRAILHEWSTNGVERPVQMHPPSNDQVLKVRAGLLKALAYERNAIINLINRVVDDFDAAEGSPEAEVKTLLEVIAAQIMARGPVVRPPSWSTKKERVEVEKILLDFRVESGDEGGTDVTADAIKEQEQRERKR